jgi:plastocyanin
LAVLTLAVAACAPTAPAASPAALPAGGGGQQQASPAGGGADCTKASKVTVGAHGTIGPSPVRLQRGAFIAVTNKSGNAHRLEVRPDAGLVTSILAGHERQVVQFPKAGEFVLSAGDASIHVIVKGESGCGVPKPTLTIKDGYVFAPAKLSVKPTANFTVVNKSGAAHSILCDPDPGGNRDNTRLEQGESEILAFDKPGHYTCHSVQHPSAKVVITVTG